MGKQERAVSGASSTQSVRRSVAAASASSSDELPRDEADHEQPGISLLRTMLTSPDEMYIELAEPHRTYFPGDAVRGKVWLILEKPTRTQYVSIKLSGQVVVSLNKQRNTKHLFQDYFILRGRTKDGTVTPGALLTSQTSPSKPSLIARKDWSGEILPAGRHVFDFEFPLPTESLPSTVDFGRGRIVYSLRCDHQKPKVLLRRGRNSARKDIVVLDAIDVARYGERKQRVVDFDPKNKRREGTGKAEALVEVPRWGFLKGDTIVPSIQLRHYRPVKNLRGAIVTLCRLGRFDSPELAPQTFRKDLVQSVTALIVDPQTLEYKVSPKIKIPADAFPTIRQAGPVSFRYYIEVVLDLNSKTAVFQTVPTDTATLYVGDDGTQMIETEALKRERGVYSVQFEVIVGTRSGAAKTRNVSDAASSAQSLSRSLSVADHGGSGYSTSTQYPLSKGELLMREQALMPSAPPEADIEEETTNEKQCSEIHLLPSEPPDDLPEYVRR
ncbi:ph-response sensor protein [Savitreella phatthalungensis]